MRTNVPAEPAARGPESLSRDELEALTTKRLRATISRVLDAKGPLQKRLAAAGVTSPSDVSCLDDLEAVEPTTKADLRANYPFGLLCVPRHEVVRVHASSGTGGKPTVVAFTRHDLDAWTDLMARSMAAAGLRAGMVLHNANGYGLFTGGLGFHPGADRVGATVVPVSGGFTARQVMLLCDLRAEVLVSTPSYALAIADALAASRLGPQDLSLELGFFGGEPWTEHMRAEIEVRLGLRAVNFYGLSELCGPGVASECLAARDGLHVNEDHFIAEVIDPLDGHRLGPGEEGELVFTTLQREAMPLLRYRTGDIGTLVTEPCECGSAMVRLTGLRGRQDDMVIVRGVNLHPSQVEHVLSLCQGASAHYRLVIDRSGPLDEVTLECEAADAGADTEHLGAHLSELLRSHLGLRVTVSLGPPGSVPRSEGKAVRVLDRRPARRERPRR